MESIISFERKRWLKKIDVLHLKSGVLSSRRSSEPFHDVVWFWGRRRRSGNDELVQEHFEVLLFVLVGLGLGAVVLELVENEILEIGLVVEARVVWSACVRWRRFARRLKLALISVVVVVFVVGTVRLLFGQVQVEQLLENVAALLFLLDLLLSL